MKHSKYSDEEDAKRIFVDIDETICYYKGERLYEEAIPVPSRIAHINELFDVGNYIVYWTARGIRSGIDYTELTTSQLTQWGCKFHEVSVGEKPHFDLLIDDKVQNCNTYFNDNLNL